MSIDKDVKNFVEDVGASEPSPDSENYDKWKAIFKRPNYFLLNKTFMVVKISRSEKPFWGVGKEILDLLNRLEEYYLVLLISSREGWVFTKSEVNANIKSKERNTYGVVSQRAVAQILT